MEQKQLQHLVNEISLQTFGLAFKHQATFNSRLKTTGGRYLLQTHNLEFNEKILTYHGLEVFKGIIKHELCHYHLHIAKKGYRHQDQDFKKLLKKVDGLRYAPSLPKTNYLLYECQKCHTKYQRQKQIDLKRYVCGKCHGQLKLCAKVN